MITWTDMVETFIVAALVADLLVPFIKKTAFRTRYLDYPEKTKVHAHPTPLLGGVAIYIAFIVGILTTMNFIHDPKMFSIVLGSTFLLVVGLIDDRMGMLPEIKLIAQFLSAMIVVKSGVRMEFMPTYYLNMIFTYLWIVGITNSFNLLDNMNGLSAGIAAIAALFLGIAMYTTHQVNVSVIAFSMAGASLGFLRHNFPKAKIFMGDTGSMLIGFVLACAAVSGSWCTRFLTTSIAMPIIILAYPVFDTLLVTLIRIKEGRSIFQGGKDHSSHRLALLGFKKKRAVLVIYGICILLGFSALMIQRLSLRSAICVIAIIMAIMVVFGIRLASVTTGRFGRNNKR